MELCIKTNLCKVSLCTLLYIFLLSSTSIVQCNASKFNEPHPHTGKVTPFQPGDPNVPLDRKALKILESGKPYKTQIEGGSGGRGLVVQDVHAPTDVVWGRILDYDNYANMVPKTVESKNYEVTKVKATKKDPLSEIIFTRMKVGFPMLRLEFFVKHLYYPSLNSLTWTLDYSKTSDFDDSCGYWYIIPHPTRPKSWTRVYYSVEVSMFDWVPKFVLDFLSTKALTDATAWVKKFSELEYAKQGGDEASNIESETNTDSLDNSSQKKRKRNIFGVFKKFRKNNEKEAETDLVVEEIQVEEEIQKENAVSWTRISLMTAIAGLSIYNYKLLTSA